MFETKSDQSFKMVFGERPHLLMSLLNDFLPLEYPIIELTYLSPEMIPEFEDGKLSIVDVRCKDSHGRYFIVEMQVGKQLGFIKRALYNTAKVYAGQLSQKDTYGIIQTVYSLNLLDHKIEDDDSNWYHHFALTNQQDSSHVLDEIHIVLIELPKWKKINKFDLEVSRDRWLIYLTEPTHFTMMTKEELKRFKEISEAIEVLEPTHLSPERIRAYELYLDNIRSRETNLYEAKKEGFAEGEATGILKGSNQTLSIMKDLKDPSNTIESISEKYGVSVEFVKEAQALLG